MFYVVLYDGSLAASVDGAFYHVPDRGGVDEAPANVEFEMHFWKKVNPIKLPVWLACHMYG